MALTDFLAGTPPRPPRHHPWRIEHRHAEGGPWTLLDEATEEALARDIAADARGTVGDLFRLTWRSFVWAFWVATPEGLREAGEVPPAYDPAGFSRHDWEAVWEGPRVDLLIRLGAAESVDPRRLVLAACDAAASVLGSVAADEPRPARKVEAARGWVAGRVDLSELLRLDRDRSYRGGLPPSAAYAFGAAQSALEAAAIAASRSRRPGEEPYRTGDGPGRSWGVLQAVGAAFRDTARASVYVDPLVSSVAEGQCRDAEDELAPLLRRHVPLSELLLARAGHGSPPPESLP